VSYATLFLFIGVYIYIYREREIIRIWNSSEEVNRPTKFLETTPGNIPSGFTLLLLLLRVEERKCLALENDKLAIFFLVWHSDASEWLNTVFVRN
jgi:hypothetical protein